VELGLDAIWYWFQSSNIADGVGFVDVERYFRADGRSRRSGAEPGSRRRATRST